MLVSWISAVLFCPEAFPQKMSDISSEHILLRLPSERALLGRRVISDLENFYQFLTRAIDSRLPKRLILLVDWDLEESRTNFQQVSIIVGMNQPAALDPQAFLAKESMREIARFGLLELSNGADRPDYEFLYEGMVEILVNEFRHTSRGLESAWVVSRYLDEMGRLSLEAQRSWSEFSGNRRSFRSASPGITFLMTFRELKGRERPNKFFATLKRANMSRSLQDAFDADASELERIWLTTVREHSIPDEIIISENEAPRLIQTRSIPEEARAGEEVRLQFEFARNSGVLLPEGVFVRDERTGKVYPSAADSEFISCVLPVESGTAAGRYGYDVTAVDESGNLRRFKGTYMVVDSR